VRASASGGAAQGLDVNSVRLLRPASCVPRLSR
jgi:hypothetical protein